ncbi:cupin domain-containing protein [Pigmentiphaga soli]|uniref:Cupin domain-containing protein n=2 Tax=Pigmentiphaga soli TaxID=1007095 RepID=A0ABP8GGQ8_9BURK
MADAEARRQLEKELARFNCRVHQPDDPPLFTREPRSPARSLLWRWSDLKPLLDRIGEMIAIGSGGMRRTLRLADPGLPYGTTPTFWGSIQVILPGEVAQAHRHMANALRFVMQGHGCSTTVDGECYEMNEGDLVLTPSGTWHDHVHRGSAPMIWLDVLDISLVRSLHATFFDPYTQAEQPVAGIRDESFRQYGSGLMSPPGLPRPARNPLLAYPRAMSMAALEQAAGLEPDPFDDVILEYRNPADGGSTMPTLGQQLQMLRPGFRGRARRHTGSKLYYVVRGEGASVVEGVRHDWSAGDFLTIAPWAWHEHLNRSAERDAILFQVNDLPALRALGYYREEALSAGGGFQMIEHPQGRAAPGGPALS